MGKKRQEQCSGSNKVYVRSYCRNKKGGGRGGGGVSKRARKTPTASVAAPTVAPPSITSPKPKKMATRSPLPPNPKPPKRVKTPPLNVEKSISSNPANTAPSGGQVNSVAPPTAGPPSNPPLTKSIPIPTTAPPNPTADKVINTITPRKRITPTLISGPSSTTTTTPTASSSTPWGGHPAPPGNNAFSSAEPPSNPSAFGSTNLKTYSEIHTDKYVSPFKSLADKTASFDRDPEKAKNLTNVDLGKRALKAITVGAYRSAKTMDQFEKKLKEEIAALESQSNFGGGYRLTKSDKRDIKLARMAMQEKIRKLNKKKKA